MTTLGKVLGMSAAMATALIATATTHASAQSVDKPVTILSVHAKADTVFGETRSTRSVNGCSVESETLVSADKTEVSYFSDEYNWCTHQSFNAAYGLSTPSTFKVLGNLDSVHVVSHIPLRDPDTGTLSGASIALDDVWSATSDPYRGTYRESTRSPSVLVYQFMMRGVIRDAHVTGTLPLAYGSVGRDSTLEFRLEKLPRGT
jgi:hypothetical protein